MLQSYVFQKRQQMPLGFTLVETKILARGHIPPHFLSFQDNILFFAFKAAPTAYGGSQARG